MSEFIKGRELCRRFYVYEVQKLLADIEHDAVLVGEGSEVQGYDQPISADHNWGVRLTLFLKRREAVPQVRERLLNSLPETYLGLRVLWEENASNLVVTTASSWLAENLGIQDVSDISVSHWLALPQQHLLQFTGGIQLGGNLGDYQRAKEILAWYPADVWRWLMASQWYLIWGTERLIPRTRDAGDLLGCQLLVHKLLRYVVQLYFLQNKKYQPYDKWLGTAFSEIPGQQYFSDRFFQVLSVKEVEEQIVLLHQMLLKLGEFHNTLSLTKSVAPKLVQYQVGIDNAVRPYEIINSAEYQSACLESIQDSALRNLTSVGSIDQLTASDAMINFTSWKSTLQEGYEQRLRSGRN